MKTYPLVLITLFIFITYVECSTKAPNTKLSKNTQKHVNRLVDCLTPVDTVLAAKTADCNDKICVSSAKKYAQSRYPQQYKSTVEPCLSSTTPLPNAAVNK